MSKKKKARSILIDGGVEAIKEYGYPMVSAENIMSDEIYRAFFSEMLKGTKGIDRQMDDVILEMLNEIEVNSNDD